MSRGDHNARQTLEQDLADLKLLRIAEIYKEVLDEAARKGSTPLQVLATLVAAEAAARSERALQRRIHHARLPKAKTLDEYDFTFPKRIPKQTILRLFDCDFVGRHGCAVFIGRHWKNASAHCIGLRSVSEGYLGTLHPGGGHDQRPDHRPHQRHPGQGAAHLYQGRTPPPR